MASEELAVLAAACKNAEIYQIISEDDDLFGAYADVFAETKQYYNQYKQAPTFDILRRKFPDLEDVEVTAPTLYYLEQLKNSYLRGRIEHTLLRAGKGLKVDTPTRVLEVLTKEFAKLTRVTANVVDVNIMDTDLAREHYEQVAARVEENGTLGIPTGFIGMDSSYTTGFASGHLCYAMGFSGKGKSWFSPLMALRAWQHGVKPMIVSLEMTPEAMRDRVYTMHANSVGGLLKNDELTRGQIDFDTYDTWAKTVKDSGHPEFVVVSGTAGQDVTPNFIQSKIEQHHPGFIVIDYQQLLMDNEKSMNMTQRMTSLSRELKILAVNNQIPILVISSVTDSDNGRDVAPTIDQLAWARAMEYNADMIFAVHRKDATENVLEIIGRKNRFGPLWAMCLDIDFNTGKFEELIGMTP
jgi:replicative DNA helicase